MKTVIANWKMYVGARESLALARAVLYALRGRRLAPDVVLCPPFVALSDVRKLTARSKVALGAQDVFWEDQGPFTGEISVRMLEEFKVSHVLVGHSERRKLGETDEAVNKKMDALIAGGMTPVLCVGETASERDLGKAKEVVTRQLREALKGTRFQKKDRLFIAYEPVWAIGTGRNAQVSDVVDMHQAIRKTASDLPAAVIYGGSVDEKNAYAFLREPEIEGVLVGGASVRVAAFANILEAASQAIEGETFRHSS